MKRSLSRVILRFGWVLIMPHPEYAQQHFICVLSPTEATFERVRLLLAEAHAIAVRRYTSQNKNK